MGYRPTGGRTNVIHYDRRAAALKTPEAAFLNVLEREFRFSPRVAGEVLNAARETLDGTPTGLRPGQMRLVVARLEAPFGPPLADSAKLEVTLTVDAGREDATSWRKRAAKACAVGGSCGCWPRP